jgi:hypothetical protein
MGEPVSRRTWLALPALVAACVPRVEILPSETLAINVPELSQPQFFESIRAFSNAHGYSLEEEGAYEHAPGIARAFVLDSWRSEIQIASGRVDREYSATDFRAYFYGRILWGLSDRELADLAVAFADAMSNVDGIRIESVQF